MTHYLQMANRDGEIVTELVCMAGPDGLCHHRPEGFEDGDWEEWTAEQAGAPGYSCWAEDWVDAAGIENVVVLGDSMVLARRPVHIAYDNGLMISPGHGTTCAVRNLHRAR